MAFEDRDGRVNRRLVAATAGISLAAAVGARAAMPAGTPRIRHRSAAAGAHDGNRASGGGDDAARAVAELERLRIGGADQWVLQRSQDIANPVVLFLHGGPGTSQLTANRRNTRELEQDFVVVTWDQRGAGKSYRAIADEARMNIDQFVADTRELTEHLLRKYNQQRIALVGHSWGSVIGALTVAEYPELFSCYVGIGQVARMVEGEQRSYAWTLEQALARNDTKAVSALREMGAPPYSGNWQAKTVKQRTLLARYGGEIHGSGRGAMQPVLQALLFSREYTLLDRVNYFRGIFGSMRLLWPELMGVDLFERVPDLQVPVILVEGRYDMESPSVVAERYFEALRAPAKELVWFERSAHLPNTEERDRFNQLLIEKVRPLAVGDRDP